MHLIAIVDDMEEDKTELAGYLSRYQKEKSTDMKAVWFQSAESFLENYHNQFDIVFMDIRMGGMDGMKAARKLRQVDQSVVLIFLTSLAQYAIQGYEVDALDYIVKPLTYPSLEFKLARAIKRIPRRDDEILIGQGSHAMRLPSGDLKYVEIFEHHLQYKTTDGTITGYGTLKDVEKSLPESGFFRINNQTIVGLRHVESVNGSVAIVGGRSFDISRMRKKDFLVSFHSFNFHGVES